MGNPGGWGVYATLGSKENPKFVFSPFEFEMPLRYQIENMSRQLDMRNWNAEGRFELEIIVHIGGRYL